MSFDFINYKETQYLRPLQLPNKEDYYIDLNNIEDSWTGRMDAQLANTFLLESIRLVINAIVLFEKGYVDCAYYSLRQSLEVSTTMVYLIELEAEYKKKELNKWKSQSRFPMYGQMLKFLKESGKEFADIKEKMEDYFKKIQEVKEFMNKYVHKQGFNTFYIAQNHISGTKDDRDALITDFEKCLISCIGAIAVFRLAIDPFPVLLMDYEIYSRTMELMTEPYSEEFVEKYIGAESIEAYKRTDIYQGYYEYLMNEEQRSPAVVDVTKHQYIDKGKVEEILEQAHLLSKTDFIAVALASLSEKVAKIYSLDGLFPYSTSTRSVRTDFSYHSRVFKGIKDSENHLNIPYDEAFLTYLAFETDDYFVEHNEIFTPDEYIAYEAQIRALLLLAKSRSET